MLKKTMLICTSCIAFVAVGSVHAETFSAAKIKEIRQQATKATESPEDTPEGWSKSRVNPNKLLGVFKPLVLRKGFLLKAYVFKEEGNGNGVVWAMPSTADFPDPKDCPTLESHLMKAPKPADALDDAMEAIEGDKSAWSYLAASLLRRELSGFAARWHGDLWGAHVVLDEDPWKGGPVKPDDSPLDRPTSKPTEWKWFGDCPKSYAPEVKRGEDEVNVTFYTYCALDKERLYRHIDTYRVGKYRPKVAEKPIAEGPNGVAY